MPTNGTDTTPDHHNRERSSHAASSKRRSREAKHMKRVPATITATIPMAKVQPLMHPKRWVHHGLRQASYLPHYQESATTTPKKGTPQKHCNLFHTCKSPSQRFRAGNHKISKSNAFLIARFFYILGFIVANHGARVCHLFVFVDGT